MHRISEKGSAESELNLFRDKMNLEKKEKLHIRIFSIVSSLTSIYMDCRNRVWLLFMSRISTFRRKHIFSYTFSFNILIHFYYSKYLPRARHQKPLSASTDKQWLISIRWHRVNRDEINTMKVTTEKGTMCTYINTHIYIYIYIYICAVYIFQ